MDDFLKGGVHKTNGFWWVIFQRGEVDKIDGFWWVLKCFSLLLKLGAWGVYFGINYWWVLHRNNNASEKAHRKLLKLRVISLVKYLLFHSESSLRKRHVYAESRIAFGAGLFAKVNRWWMFSRHSTPHPFHFATIWLVGHFVAPGAPGRILQSRGRNYTVMQFKRIIFYITLRINRQT